MADLFCGAGGTSTGAVEAIQILGYRADLTAINHWPIAIATHTLNHPGARHLTTGLDSVNPLHLYKRGELDFLWASPECTHHSNARGGKPIRDQSRATAWCVIRWAEALLPNVILIENVPEFRTWGPVNAKGRPIPKLKGEIFESWIRNLQAIGYKVEYRVINTADYGDPTERKRLFIQAVRGNRKVTWPNPTHASPAAMKANPELLRLRPWRVTREVIDFDIRGTLVSQRDKPLSPKTMKRIIAGFLKQNNLQPYIVPNFGERQGQTPRSHSIDLPLPTVTGRGAGNLITPFLVELRGSSEAHIESSSRSMDQPLGTVTASGTHFMKVDPVVIEIDHASGPETGRSVDSPLSVVTCKQRHAIATPIIVPQHSSNEARSIDRPAPTVLASSRGIGIAIPRLEPCLVQVNHGNGKEGDKANNRRVKSLDQPLPTVCGSRGEWAIVTPSVLPQQSGGELRSIDEPCPTVATAGAIALVKPELRPYTIQYYGTGTSTDIDEPLPTVTTKERHGLVLPVLVMDGKHYLVDFEFRMLQPKELAGAQGFRKDYKFEGNKTEQVAQIGNAVPRNTARALALAALSGNPNVGDLIDWEEVAA